MPTSTGDLGLCWPAEWEPHQSSLVAWPGRPEVWGPHLALGRRETLRLIAAIARTEPVVVAAPPDQAPLIREQAGGLAVTVLEMPVDDCWARDIAPLFALSAAGEVTAVDFRFNAWGGKFHPFDADADFGRRVASTLGYSCVRSDLVLEGGSLSVDGMGTALLVQDTVLNDNRNPGWTREAVEDALHATLGVERVIWLPYGLLDDTDTDGHVDNVAVFVGPSTVLCQAPPTAAHPDHDRLVANLAVLKSARTATGSQLDLVEVPWLPVTPLAADRPASYVNTYLSNGQALVPVVGAPSDDAACRLIEHALPMRKVVPVPARALSYGGGGAHCMTMQIPLPNANTGARNT